jgi:NAD(P)-dependent dehydrogenase (short-subunit alcohol dehydrogenase family)
MTPENYTPKNDLLNKRVILVTGAGDGIGRQAALSYAAHGATVILLGRTIRKLEAVYDAIEASGGPKPAIYPMNLEGATEAEIQSLAETIENEFSRLDGLLHNAALFHGLTPIQHHTYEKWVGIIQANLNAPFLLSRSLIPLLARADDASMIFTSADVGIEGKAYWGAYGVSKFAINGLMQILADELEENTSIRVNSINPGTVATRIRALAYPGESPKDHPSPASIMQTYLYLMGADSKNVNGQTLLAQ